MGKQRPVLLFVWFSDGPGNFWGAQTTLVSFSCCFFIVLVPVWPGGQKARAASCAVDSVLSVLYRRGAC